MNIRIIALPIRGILESRKVYALRATIEVQSVLNDLDMGFVILDIKPLSSGGQGDSRFLLVTLESKESKT